MMLMVTAGMERIQVCKCQKTKLGAKMEQRDSRRNLEVSDIMRRLTRVSCTKQPNQKQRVEDMVRVYACRSTDVS